MYMGNRTVKGSVIEQISKFQTTAQIIQRYTERYEINIALIFSRWVYSSIHTTEIKAIKCKITLDSRGGGLESHDLTRV